MPTFRVTVSRFVTESTRIEVEADTEKAAEQAALRMLVDGMDSKWRIDAGSWNGSDPYVAGVERIDR